MSDYLDDDFDGNESDLVKQLRKQLRDKDKRLSEIETQFTELRNSARRDSLSKVLQAHGAKPGLARFFPADSDPTEENVLAWLKEEGDLFGWTPPAAEQPQESAPVDEAEAQLRASYERVANTERAADAVAPDAGAQTRAFLDSLDGAGSLDAAVELIRRGG